MIRGDLQLGWAVGHGGMLVSLPHPSITCVKTFSDHTIARGRAASPESQGCEIEGQGVHWNHYGRTAAALAATWTLQAHLHGQESRCAVKVGELGTR